MGNSLYKIRHYNIRLLIENGFVLADEEEAGPEYRAFWWNQIPLGHSWVKEDLKYSNCELLRHHIWQTIKETLNFYCASRKEIDFNQLSSYWESKKDDCFQEMLYHLFAPFDIREDNYSSDLTLVICTRNRPQQLKNCLDSLSFLSHQPKEIIVVDNASGKDEIKELVSQYPNIKYVLEAKIGLDHARNAGWQQATSSLVAYMDDDVTLQKDWTWQIEHAFDNPRVMAMTGLVFAAELKTKAQVIFEKYWSFNRGYQDIYYDVDYFRQHLKYGIPAWDAGAGANMAFRRAALEAVGGFDNRLDVGASGCSGDSEMWYRLMAAGWTIHYTPRAISFHTHRKEMSSLKHQIYYYMRGNTSSILVQYQRHRHQGDLRYLFNTLPIYYFKTFILRIRYPHAEQYSTLFREILGSLSGIFYFIRHRKLSPEGQFNHYGFPVQK
ncbi:MAG: glycosyltransferase family 2 protein, partial [Chitinophagaceae bacterium]